MLTLQEVPFEGTHDWLHTVWRKLSFKADFLQPGSDSSLNTSAQLSPNSFHVAEHLFWTAWNVSWPGLIMTPSVSVCSALFIWLCRMRCSNSIWADPHQYLDLGGASFLSHRSTHFSCFVCCNDLHIIFSYWSLIHWCHCLHYLVYFLYLSTHTSVDSQGADSGSLKSLCGDPFGRLQPVWGHAGWLWTSVWAHSPAAVPALHE